jgi:hypothetical protein
MCYGLRQTKRLPDYVGTRILRFADRNRKGKEGIHTVSQEIDQRWLHHVPVQHLPAPLPQPRKCRSAYPAHQKEPASKRARRHTMYYRQTIWHDGNLLRHEKAGRKDSSTAIRDVLRKTGRQFLPSGK